MAKSKLDFKALLQRVASLFTHNWQWKLISVLLAVALWSGLITQDDTLTRSKTFEDVTINVLNADTLRHNGFIVVDGLQDLPTVTIEADVPQKNYNAAAASNYNLRVDLSRIRSAGEQTLNLLTTTTTSYGSVSEMSVSSITVQVELDGADFTAVHILKHFSRINNLASCSCFICIKAVDGQITAYGRCCGVGLTHGEFRGANVKCTRCNSKECKQRFEIKFLHKKDIR